MAPVAALRACPLFKDFTHTGLQIIAEITEPRTFARGSALFVENASADSLLILSSGKVKLSATSPAGESLAIGELGPGDCLGELSLIRQGQRLCTATAMLEVTALEIKQASFQTLFAKKPQACIKLLMGIVSFFGQKVTESRDAFKSLLVKG
ncbi:MAG TPA: cyclic nucleotide-binding domain-containing protein [Myxococcaceae bacterium]|nr:cyclic nucleotide-binding domain-containing protein [Myxococcaceae bacterium]